MPNNTINFGPILCSACSLHDQAAHPGLPTRPLWQRPATPSWTNLAPIPVGSSKQALVVVGMAPGRDEDELGMSWVGWSGRFLYRILTESLELHKHADIYLSNACRCYNPPGEKIRKGQLSACRPHLLRDLQTIVQRYGPANVVVLALGSEAVSTLVGTSIKAAVAYQGVPRTLLDSTELPPLPVFVSYHPAMFLPGRDPARVEPFNVHLQLLKDYFTKPRKILSFPKPLINAAPQQIRCPRVVSLDIETYGLLRGKEQTVFHPAKSESVDGIPRSRQVLCVSLAWRTLDGIKAAFYDLTNEKHRRNFTLVLQFIIRRNFTLVGMNIPFDLSYLRLCMPQLALLLKPFTFRLDDVSILNHLHGDLRPERSLKALSTLFGLARYHELKVSTLPTGQKAKSAYDPDLIYYNVMDAVVTLQLYEKMRNELADRWSGLPLSNDIRAGFRSNLLWTALHMAEYGIKFDLEKLRKRQDQLGDEQDRAFVVARQAGYIVGGTGSVKSTRLLLTRSLDSVGLLDDRRVEYTKKRGELSTGKENYNFALAELPIGHLMRPAVQALKDYRTSSSESSSYTKPLLTEPAIGCGLDGRAYPSWYPVPAFVKDAAGGEGGTRQARFAAHGPAAQTFPPGIKKCLVSRYLNGVLIECDLSQAELRVPALLSGDPAMIKTFREDGDIHDETTATLSAAGLTADTPHDLRQVGKRLNFLMQYRGGAYKFVIVCRQQLGIEISLEFAKAGIKAYWLKYYVLRNWQDELIESVKQLGFANVPTGWQRTFVRDTFAIEQTYINEICNFPIQTTAAQVFQSAHAAVLEARETSHLTFTASLQNHDALILDTPRDQAAAVQALVHPILSNPPLWIRLQEIYGREVPMKYEATQL